MKKLIAYSGRKRNAINHVIKSDGRTLCGRVLPDTVISGEFIKSPLRLDDECKTCFN